jgi:hypothetical protein
LPNWIACRPHRSISRCWRNKGKAFPGKVRRTADPSASLLMTPIELLVEYRGIPHLAKNERDVGHPSLCCPYRRPVIPLPTRFSESAARDDKGQGGGCIQDRIAIEKRLHSAFCPATAVYETAARLLSSRAPAEGSAVLRTLPGNVFAHQNPRTGCGS